MAPCSGPAGRRSPAARLGALGALASSAVALVVVIAASLNAEAGSAAAGEPERVRGPRAARAVTIAWAGDTTLGSTWGLPAEAGWEVLSQVAPVLRAADVTAVNYEGTLATQGVSKCGGSTSTACFAFRAPPENAAALRRAGVDVANLANNHAYDYGPGALDETAAALDGAGLGVAGQPGSVLVRRVAGRRVAFLGFSTYPWSESMRDLERVGELVRGAAGEADIVVAMMHAGAEGLGQEHTPLAGESFLGEDRGDVRAFARAAIDAGADLVLGSGPHVLRGIELYRGRVIAYSLGNLGGYRTFSAAGNLALSGVLAVRLDDRGRFAGGRFTSLVLDGIGIPRVDPAGQAAGLVSELGAQDFPGAALAVGPDGRLRRAAPTDDAAWAAAVAQ